MAHKLSGGAFREIKKVKKKKTVVTHSLVNTGTSISLHVVGKACPLLLSDTLQPFPYCTVVM